MDLSPVSRSTAVRPTAVMRCMAGAVVAALAFASCGLTTGETAIEASDPSGAPSVPATTEPVVPTAPVVAPTETAVATYSVATDSVATDSGAIDSASTSRGERSTASDETVAEAPADDVATEAPTPVPVPEEIVEVEEAPADASTTESTEDEATETASFNQVDVASCMQGVWASQPGQVGDYTARLSELTGASMSASGQITVALDNGRYVYDAFITTSIDVDGFQTWSVVEGITQGNFTLTNGFIVAEQTFAELDAYVELPDGTRIDAGVLGEEFNQMAAFHEVPFDCTGGDTITLHFDTLPGTARFPMTFERRP